MTLNFIVMGLGGFAWGAASDRFGAAHRRDDRRPCCSAWRWCWRAAPRSLLQFQLTYGILVGLAASTFFAPMIAADDRLVRHQPQPCGVAGLGRHGRRADDDLALRALADLGL